MTADDPVTVARRIADELERGGVPYAIGGALALAYCGVARGTHDVDVNAFVDVSRFDAVAEALERAGVSLDREDGRRRAADGEYVRAHFGTMPVDVFFDSIPLHESAAARVQVRPLMGRPARILSAEDLAVLKMLFHRGKDLVDVERMLVAGRDTLDREYVRRWLADTAGDDNYRVADWDAMVRDLG